MSESSPQNGSVSIETAVGHAGDVVRAAREARGQTLLHLSLLLKITERRLQAFEDGRWSDVGDRTFVRALAQSLCRHLDIDPQPVLQSLPAASSGPRVQPDRGPLPQATSPSLKTLRRPVQMPGSGKYVGGFTPVRIGVAAILLAALVLAVAPSQWWSPSATPQEVGASAPAQATASVESASAPPDSSATQPLESTAPSPSAMASAQPPAQAVPQVPAVSGSASIPARPEETATPSPSRAAVLVSMGSTAPVDPSSLPLQIKASQDTWVQVSDAKGTVLLSRLLRAGERVPLDGTRPLRLRVGNVAGTEVQWLGKPLSLEDTKRNNVADVQLP